MKKSLSLLGFVAASLCANPSVGSKIISSYDYHVKQPLIQTESEPSFKSDVVFYFDEPEPRSKSQAIRYALADLNETLPWDIPFARIDELYSQPLNFQNQRRSPFSYSDGFSYDVDVSLDKFGVNLNSGDGMFAGLFTDIDIELKASLSPDYHVRLKRELSDHLTFEVTTDEKDTSAYLVYKSDSLNFREIPGQMYEGLVKLVTFQK